MKNEFNGIEKRLDDLSDRLARLEPLRVKPREDFDKDPYLRDIVERNLEICAQCCIDICHRITRKEKATPAEDYYGSILLMGEIGVIPMPLARKLAPLAGFRNILIHEYLGIDWDQVYKNLQNLQDLNLFSEIIREWLLTKYP